MKDAMTKHTDADVMVTFASLRSAYESAVETMQFPQIRTIAIIAEGIPENMTRKLILMAQHKGVTIIGPATVGGLKPGCFKIGNTGGMMDNILHSKLYRPGRYHHCSLYYTFSQILLYTKKLLFLVLHMSLVPEVCLTN